MSDPEDDPGEPNWRDDAWYQRLRDIDRAGLMWEWNRRDPSYVAWHTRASRATRGAPAVAPLEWGLHFRRRPSQGSAACAHHMARRNGSRHPARDGDAMRR